MTTCCSPNDEAALRAAQCLSVTQVNALQRVRDRGSLAWCAGRGRAGGAVSRMFDRMKTQGLVAGPPYEVTEYGLRVLTAYETGW